MTPAEAAATYPQLVDPATEDLIEHANAATVYPRDLTRCMNAAKLRPVQIHVYAMF